MRQQHGEAAVSARMLVVGDGDVRARPAFSEYVCVCVCVCVCVRVCGWLCRCASLLHALQRDKAQSCLSLSRQPPSVRRPAFVRCLLPLGERAACSPRGPCSVTREQTRFCAALALVSRSFSLSSLSFLSAARLPSLALLRRPSRPARRTCVARLRRELHGGAVL